jgi:hydrogenase expression/formation protein HypE
VAPVSIERLGIAHGSGTGLNQLLAEIVLPNLCPGQTGPLEDAALISVNQGRLAFTTDAFVVSPLEFPGGDIGKLAACGTINDLAMMGALPLRMAVALILEEGLDCSLLGRVLRSLAAVCAECGMAIVCGDTKVVDRGKADGIFITTTGIGAVADGINLSAAHARPGDAVLVSGPIGRHGIAILAQRKNLGFASEVISDCQPLSSPVQRLLAAVPRTRLMRDATRGGCAAVLNEIALASGVTVRLQKSALPVPAVVAGACAILGFDPLQIANEGCFVAIVPADQAQCACATLRTDPYSRDAAIIGRVEECGRVPVMLETEIGGLRPVEVPPGQLLPRIC